MARGSSLVHREDKRARDRTETEWGASAGTHPRHSQTRRLTSSSGIWERTILRRTSLEMGSSPGPDQGSAPNCDSSGGPSSAVAEASSEARARTARRAREKEADARGANRRRVASPSFAEPRTRAATDATSA